MMLYFLHWVWIDPHVMGDLGGRFKIALWEQKMQFFDFTKT